MTMKMPEGWKRLATYEYGCHVKDVQLDADLIVIRGLMAEMAEALEEILDMDETDERYPIDSVTVAGRALIKFKEWK